MFKISKEKKGFFLWFLLRHVRGYFFRVFNLYTQVESIWQREGGNQRGVERERWNNKKVLLWCPPGSPHGRPLLSTTKT